MNKRLAAIVIALAMFGATVAAAPSIGQAAETAAQATAGNSFWCYEVENDASIYESPGSAREGTIAEGRHVRGPMGEDQGAYWAVKWWKYGAGDSTWSSLWTISSAWDTDYIHYSNLTVVPCR